MQESYGSQSKTKLMGIIVTILVIAGTVLVADHIKNEKAESVGIVTPTTTSQPVAPPTSSTATTTPSSSTNAGSTTTSGYKDGTYSATSSYYVPHSSETIRVTATVKDGVVTSSSITNSEGDGVSASYQQGFASIYKSYVVGKKINGLSLSRIAGASDTTQGFNDALAQIANQAQS